MSDAKPKRKRRCLRVLTAALIGLAGSVVIWVAAPYNNFILRTSYITDSFLPLAALLLTLVLVLGVNPLLRWLAPAWALDKRQLAIIVGVLFVACVLPGQGLLRMLPYGVANVPIQARENRRLADAYEQSGLPRSLFPDRVAHQADTPVAEHFLSRLPAGETVPWGAWVRPAVTWGGFLLACWLMMLGLSLIVLPQWRRNERLPFPLLTVQEALIEQPEQGAFAPLFRKRSFWIAAGAVVLLHVLAGANNYDPEGIPAVPLKWDLSRLFTEEPLNHLPAHIHTGRLYFVFLGVAFFMPSRIGFSIWFFALVYGGYRVVGKAYFPPFNDTNVFRDQRAGAMVAMTLGILWLGRRHWAEVFSTLCRRAVSEADRRNRRAAVMFTAGCAGMGGFMVWAGVHPLWALFYVAFAFMVSVLITRIVAETGMPFVRIDTRYETSFVKLAPTTWLQPASLYFSAIVAMLFTIASRVSCTTMAAHAIGLDREASPRHQSNLATWLIALLAVGLVVCGAVHLYANYHHAASLDGTVQPVNRWGTRRLDNAGKDLLKLADARRGLAALRAEEDALRALPDDARADARAELDKRKRKLLYPFEEPYNQPAHMLLGAGLAGLLQYACMIWPKWPVHPIGLIMANTFYTNEAWVSVMIGWLLKVLVLRYGGARLYRAARPLFLGVIMGAVFAAAVWAIEPAVRVALDLPYKTWPVQPY